MSAPGKEPWFSKDEAERAMQEVEQERKRKELAKHPRKPIELTPEQRNKGVVVRSAAKTWGIPEDLGFVVGFVDTATGDVRPYITKPGMLWKLAQFHPRSVQTRVEPHPTIEGGWIATAEIVRDLSDKDQEFLSRIAETKDRELFLTVFRELTKPTIATGSAYEGNLKEKQGPWAREMAETRALLRAARVFTGMGLVTPEEREE